MKIAYVTAGAGGMYCGSCIHDNSLAAALQKMGHDVALVPVYTPLRTDETNVTLDRVFYGAINVYLQQRVPLFRHTPRLLDRWLDRPGLLRWVSRFAASTNARQLGELTLSMLRGEEGRQRKELLRLVEWLRDDFRPELVQLTNSMLLGLARQLREELRVPVVCAIQGEDIFLQELEEPHRSRVMDTLRHKAADVDLFLATSRYYADFMAQYLGIEPEKIAVARLGLHLEGHGEPRERPPERPFVVGYLARICPEKGLHLLVDAFRELRRRVGPGQVKLRVAGYLGGRDQAYFKGVCATVKSHGLEGDFEYLGEVDRQRKIEFLHSLHVLSVPTTYHEPKGLYVLEALANGVPVVQPRHGAFPELVEQTGGGVLVTPDSPLELAAGIEGLMTDRELRHRLAQRGREAVHRGFGAEVMAAETLAAYEGLMAVGEAEPLSQAR